MKHLVDKNNDYLLSISYIQNQIERLLGININDFLHATNIVSITIILSILTLYHHLKSVSHKHHSITNLKDFKINFLILLILLFIVHFAVDLLLLVEDKKNKGEHMKTIGTAAAKIFFFEMILVILLLIPLFIMDDVHLSVYIIYSFALILLIFNNILVLNVGIKDTLIFITLNILASIFLYIFIKFVHSFLFKKGYEI